MNSTMQRTLLAALALTTMPWLVGCEGAEEEQDFASIDQEVINGNAVTGQTIRDLGLADVGGGCSGVLYTNNWVFTAGHCVSQWNQTGTWVNYNGVWAVSDRVYRFGGYNDGQGPDLAMIHVATPFAVNGSTNGYSRGILLRAAASLAGTPFDIYGRGDNSVTAGGFGIWRTARETVASAAGDMLSFSPNGSGQTAWFGDSGGPSFADVGGGPVLVGIQSGASWTCAASSPPGMCVDQRPTGASQVFLLPLIWGMNTIMDSAWDTTRSVQFFDTTGVEIRAAREVEVDVNTVPWTQLNRVAAELCTNRGFVGGHYNGHQLHGRYGLACSGPGAAWFDATPTEINNTGWGFYDEEQTQWAQAARAANEVCKAKGFVSGFFNGYQILGSKYGVYCVNANVQHFDASWADLDATGWRVDDVNSVNYAQGLRAANGFCVSRGFVTGFMNGHQLNGYYGVTCQR